MKGKKRGREEENSGDEKLKPKKETKGGGTGRTE